MVGYRVKQNLFEKGLFDDIFKFKKNKYVMGKANAPRDVGFKPFGDC